MKIIKIIVVVMSSLLLFTACSDKTQSGVSGTDNSSLQTVSQSPERPAEIYGQVKTIMGNEVTLSLAESPDNTELSEAEKAKRKSDMQALSPEERQQLRNEQIRFTGETKEVIIPVGTPITSGSIISSGDTLKELSLAEIYEGIFLRIWIEEGEAGDAHSAEYVRVLQSQQ